MNLFGALRDPTTPAQLIELQGEGLPDQMVAKLRLDGSEGLLDLSIPDYLVELGDHLARSEASKGSAALPGGAGGMGLGLLSECGFWVSATGDGVLDLKDLGLVRNKDVGGCGGFGGGHREEGGSDEGDCDEGKADHCQGASPHVLCVDT